MIGFAIAVAVTILCAATLGYLIAAVPAARQTIEAPIIRDLADMDWVDRINLAPGVYVTSEDVEIGTGRYALSLRAGEYVHIPAMHEAPSSWL